MCVSYKQHVSKPVELVELDQELKEKPKHKPVVSEYSKLGRERAFLYSFLMKLKIEAWIKLPINAWRKDICPNMRWILHVKFLFS